MLLYIVYRLQYKTVLVLLQSKINRHQYSSYCNQYTLWSNID